MCSNNYGNSKKLIHPVCEKGQGHKMLLIIESSLQPSNVLLVGDTLSTGRQKAKEWIFNGVAADTSWSSLTLISGVLLPVSQVALLEIHEFSVYGSVASQVKWNTATTKGRHSQLTHWPHLGVSIPHFSLKRELSKYLLYLIIDLFFCNFVQKKKLFGFFSFYYVFSTKSILDWVLAKVIIILILN